MPNSKESPMLKEIGRLIRQGREMLGMTQEDLAVKLGKTPDAISNYEQGKRALRITELPALADALRVPLSLLLTENQEIEKLVEVAQRWSSLPEAQRNSLLTLWLLMVATVENEASIEQNQTDSGYYYHLRMSLLDVPDLLGIMPADENDRARLEILRHIQHKVDLAHQGIELELTELYEWTKRLKNIIDSSSVGR